MLGDGIRTARVEGCGLGLRHLPDFSVKLGSGSLVEFDTFFEPASTNCVQHAEDPDSIAVSSVFGHIEGNLYVGHGSKVVDFIRAHISNDGNKIGGIAKISVVEEEFDAGLVPVLVDVINASGVEYGCATDDSVDLFANELNDEW